MKTEDAIVADVADIYAWIDSRIAGSDNACSACGECCDFDSYDHRLFVTSPELIYFTLQMAPDQIKSLPGGTCPYNIDGKCSVYRRRFAACRIFACKGDADFQNNLSEQAMEKFKSVCEKLAADYQYTDIKTALNRLSQSGE